MLTEEEKKKNFRRRTRGLGNMLNSATRVHGGGGKSSSPFVPGTVPKVVASETTMDGTALLVKFDRPMTMTTNLQDALTVTIDGTVVKPDHIVQDATKSIVGMQYPVGFFKPGQVVTWAYDDQHPTEELKGAEANGKEIDNQTYSVVNKSTHIPTVLSSTIYANNSKRIVVEWDQSMKGTPDVRFAISMTIDGGSPIVPETIIFNKNAGKYYMMLVMTNDMVTGQTIQWHYEPSSTERLSTVVGDHEATGVPHVVDNQLVPHTKLSYDGTTATDTDGTRYLVNSVEPTTHKAPLHSGTAVTLSGDGKIEIPINQGHGSVTVFDHKTKKFEQLCADGTGSKELVANGDFSDGLNGWVKSTIGTWTVVNGELVAPAVTDTRVEQSNVLAPNKKYLVSFDNRADSDTWIEIYDGGIKDILKKKAVGSFSTVFNSGATNGKLYLRSLTDASTIDNVSVKEVLPLASTYTLKDGTFGTIIKLDTNKFSQADLDAFTARPELVLEWSAGTATIPSAIVKGVKDVVYNANGMALPIVMGAELYGNQLNIVGANGSSVVDNGDGTQSFKVKAKDFQALQLKVTDDTKKVELTFEVTSLDHPMTIINYHDGNGLVPINHVVVVGSNMLSVKPRVGEGKIYLYYTVDAVNDRELKLKTSTISAKEITSSILPITGTHTTTNTSQFGIQQIKVGAGAMNGKDDGRFIQLPLVANGKHLLKTCTKLIAGDITQVTDTPC